MDRIRRKSQSHRWRVLGLLVLGAWAFAPPVRGSQPAKPPEPTPPANPANPAIDMPGYLRAAGLAAEHRESRRLSEQEFMARQREPGVVVLDARSREAYDLLHVAGAISLPFPDIAIDSLNRTIPDRSTTILIYCNNNFANAPEPFPTKMPSASLNLSTYIALWSYGYRNIYELGPLVDLADSRLAFQSSAAPSAERP